MIPNAKAANEIMSGLDGLGWPNPDDEPKPKETINSQLEIKLATKMTDTPHDHDHNEMTPLDYALAHNKQLTQQLAEVAKDRDLWKAETKRWRDMYIEYDEMLEGDLEKAKKRIVNVISKIKSLEKEMNDEKY